MFCASFSYLKQMRDIMVKTVESLLKRPILMFSLDVTLFRLVVIVFLSLLGPSFPEADF